MLARARHLYASRQLKESPYIYQLRSYRTEIIQRQDSPKEAIFYFFFHPHRLPTPLLGSDCHEKYFKPPTRGNALVLFFFFLFLFIFLLDDVLLARPPSQSRETAANNGGKSNLIIGPVFWRKRESDEVF